MRRLYGIIRLLDGQWGVLYRCPGCGVLVWRPARSMAGARQSRGLVPRAWCGEPRDAHGRPNAAHVSRACCADEGALPGARGLSEALTPRVSPWERVDTRLSVRQALSEVAERLTDRERRILALRFWRDATLDQTGDALVVPVCRDRVRQIEAKILWRLRHWICGPRYGLALSREEMRRRRARRKADTERRLAAVRARMAADEAREAARRREVAAARNSGLAALREMATLVRERVASGVKS